MIRRNGQISSELLDPRLCDIRVFNRKDAAHTAAGATVEFNKIKVVEFFVFKLFENIDYIFNSVCCQITVCQKSSGFSACSISHIHST